MPDNAEDRNRLLRYVILAVAVWGGALSIGAFLFGLDPQSKSIELSPSFARGLIVLGCVAGFLGFWIVLLVARRRRQESEHVDEMFGHSRDQHGEGDDARRSAPSDPWDQRS